MVESPFTKRLPYLRRMIRKNARGCHNASMPIRIVAGGKQPTVEGEPSYHTTPSGKTIVHYPSAYKWKTIYHPSTQRVEVGFNWIVSQFTETTANRLYAHVFICAFTGSSYNNWLYTDHLMS